jgi:hypothetical protein
MSNRSKLISSINSKELVLDPFFQARQTEIIEQPKEQAAKAITRQASIDSIVADLKAGKGIKETLIAYELDNKVFVVDGFHRTEACHRYLKENPDKSLEVSVEVYRGYSKGDAYRHSQRINRSHGTALAASEVQHNDFKARVIDGNYKGTKRGLADEFSCAPSQGLHIMNALKACEAHHKAVAPLWDEYPEEAIERLQQLLIQQYGISDKQFDKDGFPKIRPLSNAYKGIVFGGDLTDEEQENKAIKDLTRQLDCLIAENGGERFRAALKKVGCNDTAKSGYKHLGISIKKSWDEDAVAMVFNTSILPRGYGF